MISSGHVTCTDLITTVREFKSLFKIFFIIIQSTNAFGVLVRVSER